MASYIEEDTAWSDEEIMCPYCHHAFSPDEGSYYDQNGYELDCDECHEVFIVQPQCLWSWSTKKTPRAV